MTINLIHFLKSTIAIMAVVLYLSGCSVSYVADRDHLTKKDKAKIARIWPYLPDTLSQFDSYFFNEKGQLVSINFTDNTSFDFNPHHYNLDYDNKGNLKTVSLYDFQNDYYNEIYLTSRGLVRYISEDSFLYKPRSWYYEGRHFHFFHVVKGKNIIQDQQDYYANHRSRLVNYRDDGTLDCIIYYYKNKMDGNVNYYFRNGRLKTHTQMSLGKIMSLVEYDQNGKPVPETIVENGNGRWLRCDEDGGYCSDCAIINGKVENCKSLKPENPIKHK
jgi:hypothetical protein